ncbi:branched-chain alpha-keto acid dehydrogenase E1 subunit [Candidatus Hydrogenisulfobacillus filiaventi]|uniref:Branched-chain alpha-keto acid dehydrogenase E1 subunit n=1 Tax=Candidatus Hydrogenisulfobacillus filiaventi TaxID=2707344 RepID=A0A6F8ZKQ0_9FIRM|nr:branched-chain alpha-keto acid dehydrogenase E1 subunit [Candidatus Hydrogenisulfobacillus filiaventi]
MTFLEAIRETLRQEMRRDPRIIIYGEDVGVRGGVFRVTDGLLAEFGEERVIDSPLAEAAIVGTAIGAAVGGLLPVPEIQFADFIAPAFNQIVEEAARMRYRSNNDFHVPITIRAPFGGGVHGGLYHSQSVEAFFAHVPGLKVVIPSTPYDAKGLLAASIHDPDPVLFFEHKAAYRSVKGEVPEERYLIPLGKADLKREGTDVSIIGYGLVVQHALKAAEQLAKEDGISVEVLDLRTVRPLDVEAILATARKTGKVLIVHEDNLTGGIGGEVAALIAEHALFDLDAPIRRLTGPDVPAMPFSPPLEHAFLVTPEKIAAAARELARF